jgi:hypothetical protein
MRPSAHPTARAGIVRIDIEPYHPMGEDKNRRLGRTDWFRAPFASDADKARWRTILQEWQAKNEQ